MLVPFHHLKPNGMRKRLKRQRENDENAYAERESPKKKLLVERLSNINTQQSSQSAHSRGSSLVFTSIGKTYHNPGKENKSPVKCFAENDLSSLCSYSKRQKFDSVEQRIISPDSDESCSYFFATGNRKSLSCSQKQNVSPSKSIAADSERDVLCSPAKTYTFFPLSTVSKNIDAEEASVSPLPVASCSSVTSLSDIKWCSSLYSPLNTNTPVAGVENQVSRKVSQQTIDITSGTYSDSHLEDEDEERCENLVQLFRGAQRQEADDSTDQEEELGLSNDDISRNEKEPKCRKNIFEPLNNSKRLRLLQLMSKYCNDPSLSECEKTREVLRLWHSHTRAPFTHLDLLLYGLKKAMPEPLRYLPSCGKTIAKTSTKKVVLKCVYPGEYYHIGLEKLLRLVVSILPNSCDSLSLLCNVDGIKPFDASPNELYPILISFPCIPFLKHKVFPVGIWYGIGKPASVKCYFEMFEKELYELVRNGLIVNDRRIVKIILLGLACDAPAKCMLMGIKYFNGFGSCTRCIIYGKTYNGTRIFIGLDFAKRTDKNFRNRIDRAYQPGQREHIFADIPGVDYASPFFILESMHLLFIGCSDTLLERWHAKLSAGLRQLLCDDLIAVQVWIPCEFSARRCQDFNRVVWWKAVEYRLFALYLGPIVLKNILKTEEYNHFLLFHIALFILHCPLYCNQNDYRQLARNLLRKFVEQTPDVYCKSLLTHNFHNLIHIVDDADRFCAMIPNFSLSCISAFEFENYLRYLSDLAQTPFRALQQIAKRLEEQVTTDYFKENYLCNFYRRQQASYGLHCEGPVPAFCSGPQFKKVVFTEFTIDVDRVADNCCFLSSGEIMVVENFLLRKSEGTSEEVVVGKIFTDLTNFYPESVYPESNVFLTEIGVFKGKKLSSQSLIYPVSRIKSKCFRLKMNENFVFFPLLHTDVLESQVAT